LVANTPTAVTVAEGKSERVSERASERARERERENQRERERDRDRERERENTGEYASGAITCNHALSAPRLAGGAPPPASRPNARVAKRGNAGAAGPREPDAAAPLAVASTRTLTLEKEK
jgi:hypothetical protein